MVLEILANVVSFAVSTPALLGICLGATLVILSAMAVSCFCYRTHKKHHKSRKFRGCSTFAETRPLPLKRPTAVKSPNQGPTQYLKKSPSPSGNKSPPGCGIKTPISQGSPTTPALNAEAAKEMGCTAITLVETSAAQGVNHSDKSSLRLAVKSANSSPNDESGSRLSIRFHIDNEKNGRQSPLNENATLLEEQKLPGDESIKVSGEGENKLGQLFFKLRHNAEKNALMVVIVKCAGLPVKDVSGSSTDPYVKLQLLPEKQHKVKTRVVRRTVNPFYDEDFTFYGISKNQLESMALHFVVLSFDRYSRDDVIGEVLLPVSQAIKESENEDTETSDSKLLCRDIAPRNLKMKSQSRGELLVSLCYQPAASRLTAVILKARNLPRMDITGLADPYVKIYLLYNGQRVAKKKTHVKKRTLNPVFNESFVFDIPPDAQGLENISLEFLVLDWDRVTKNEVIGRLELGGSNASGSALQHWNEVLNAPRRQIAEWHKLRD
ncbi:synaptotagmin-4-like isoform X3 [Artemia franciscana]|uniref:synaptotagmin-4-like isoform X3 n=1 Tax=Artemia franciscana TaxID=6661 RepID=UPI0032DBEECB